MTIKHVTAPATQLIYNAINSMLYSKMQLKKWHVFICAASITTMPYATAM
jgi:hypothetical protein